MKLFYKLEARTILWFLIKTLFILVLLNLSVIALEYYLNVYTDSTITGSQVFKNYVTGMFSFDVEKNIPSFFSTIIFLISGILLISISRHVKNSNQPLYFRQWYLMGCTFVWLAVDELFSMHELLIKPSRIFLKSLLQQDNLGYLHFAWVVPYVLLFVFMGVYFFKFIFSLPRKTLEGFIGSGVIFIMGAVGMEMVGGYYVANSGNEMDLIYKFCTILEEVLEMLGIILFIYSLIKYIEQQDNLIVNIAIGSEKVQTVSEVKKVLVAH